MPGYADVERVVATLPSVTEGRRYGHRTWFAGGHGFAWERPFSKADIRRFGDQPVPDGPLLGLRAADQHDKAAQVAAHAPHTFTIEHFDGTTAFLVRLAEVPLGALRRLVTDAWLSAVSEEVAREHLRRTGDTAAGRTPTRAGDRGRVRPTTGATTPREETAVATEKPASKRARATPAASAASEDVFTADERAAMKQHAAEERARRKGKAPADDEPGVRAAIASFPEPDRTIVMRLHDLIREAAPDSGCRTWYGMPAYTRDGKVVCFVQNASKFKVRYTTLGFQEDAHLDEGAMWPTSYAVTDLTPEVEARVGDLVRRAFG